MYTWRKRVTSEWLRWQGDELQARFGGALAITEQPGKARVLVEVSCERRAESTKLLREFGGTIEKLRADWLNEFAQRIPAKPLRIGSRLIASRSGDGPRTIVIPAEAAFGTGEHATTAMCLRLLERTTRKRPIGWALLDAGTGSGILAIAAARFGAKRVVGIENDPLACKVASRNARANRVRNVEIRCGDLLKQKFTGKFDIITANLFSELLIAGLPIWSRQLASGGCLILSGILRSQERAVVAALRRNGFSAAETRRRGKWIALLANPGRRGARSRSRKRP